MCGGLLTVLVAEVLHLLGYNVMKMSLLDMVQDILSDMDSDLVNSIDDTPESQQVAQIIKTTYNDLMTTMEWPHLSTLTQLNAATVPLPTHCSLPLNVMEMQLVRYDKARLGDTVPKYDDVHYLYPEEFLKKLQYRKPSESNVDIVVDPSGVSLFIINDKAPQYWTSFDDNTLVFDSYDSDVDTFLQNSKFVIMAKRQPTFEMTDDFIPDLPAESFSLLLAEAKSRSAIRLMQEPDQKAEQQATRSRVHLSRKNWRAAGGVRYPNYGRKGRK